MPGNPRTAISKTFANLPFQIQGGISGELVNEGHGFPSVGIAFFLAKSDHLLVVCSEYFRNSLQQSGFTGSLRSIQRNK